MQTLILLFLILGTVCGFVDQKYCETQLSFRKDLNNGDELQRPQYEKQIRILINSTIANNCNYYENENQKRIDLEVSRDYRFVENVAKQRQAYRPSTKYEEFSNRLISSGIREERKESQERDQFLERILRSDLTQGWMKVSGHIDNSDESRSARSKMSDERRDMSRGVNRHNEYRERFVHSDNTDDRRSVTRREVHRGEIEHLGRTNIFKVRREDLLMYNHDQSEERRTRKIADQDEPKNQDSSQELSVGYGQRQLSQLTLDHDQPQHRYVGSEILKDQRHVARRIVNRRDSQEHSDRSNYLKEGRDASQNMRDHNQLQDRIVRSHLTKERLEVSGRIRDYGVTRSDIFDEMADVSNGLNGNNEHSDRSEERTGPIANRDESQERLLGFDFTEGRMKNVQQTNLDGSRYRERFIRPEISEDRKSNSGLLANRGESEKRLDGSNNFKDWRNGAPRDEKHNEHRDRSIGVDIRKDPKYVTRLIANRGSIEHDYYQSQRRIVRSDLTVKRREVSQRTTDQNKSEHRYVGFEVPKYQRHVNRQIGNRVESQERLDRSDNSKYRRRWHGNNQFQERFVRFELTEEQFEVSVPLPDHQFSRSNGEVSQRKRNHGELQYPLSTPEIPDENQDVSRFVSSDIRKDKREVTRRISHRDETEERFDRENSRRVYNQDRSQERMISSNTLAGRRDDTPRSLNRLESLYRLDRSDFNKERREVSRRITSHVELQRKFINSKSTDKGINVSRQVDEQKEYGDRFVSSDIRDARITSRGEPEDSLNRPDVSKARREDSRVYDRNHSQKGIVRSERTEKREEVSRKISDYDSQRLLARNEVPDKNRDDLRHIGELNESLVSARSNIFEERRENRRLLAHRNEYRLDRYGFSKLRREDSRQHDQSQERIDRFDVTTERRDVSGQAGDIKARNRLVRSAISEKSHELLQKSDNKEFLYNALSVVDPASVTNLLNKNVYKSAPFENFTNILFVLGQGTFWTFLIIKTISVDNSKLWNKLLEGAKVMF